MKYSQALSELGISSEFDLNQKDGVSLHGQRLEGPCVLWLDQALIHVHLAEMALLDRRGLSAVQYLHARGFTDETIQKYRLGYMPLRNGRWQYSLLEKWGLPVQDPGKSELCLFEGIVVPWFLGDHIWKIEIRRLQRSDDGQKIASLRGSKDMLYNCNAFVAGCIVVLCESALDVISGQQEAGELAVWMATGGTQNARSSVWIELLNQASLVLVAFDTDEAGDEGAKYWLAQLPHAIRSYPWAHDVNDMVTSRQNIRLWLSNEIEHAQITLNTQHSQHSSHTQIAHECSLFHTMQTTRAYLAQLRAGTLSGDRLDSFGQWDDVIYDLEHIWMRLEKQCRGIQVLPDNSVVPVWNGQVFEDALVAYMRQAPHRTGVLDDAGLC